MPEGARVPASETVGTIEKTGSADPAPDAHPRPHTLQAQLLHWQRTVGNQAVQRLIRSGLSQPTAKTKPLTQREIAHRGERPQQPDRIEATAEPTSVPPAGLASRISPLTRQTGNAPHIQGDWYNFDIPFTDYQFDPSLEGIKTAATVVKDRAVAALEWIVDEIKSLVSYGIDWLRDEWDSIQEFASSGFEAAKNSFTNIIGFIKNPLGFLADALTSLDAEALAKAWATFSGLISTVANGFKAMTGNLLQQVSKIWGGINGFASSLLSRVSSLTENFLFKKLPDALQRIAFTVVDRLKSLWKSINDGWTRLFDKIKAWVDSALDTVFSFVRRVMSFGINVVIAGIIEFGKIVLFLKDLFTNPQEYVELLAQRSVQAFDGVESRFAGVVGQYFSGAKTQAPASAHTTQIQRTPAPEGPAETKKSATWSEIGDGVAEMMGKKWNEFKSNPMAIVTGLLMDMIFPMVGNIKDVIQLFKDIKKIVTGPLSAGSLEELWTSLLQILDIPILIYHTVVSILMRTLMIPLIVATFIPHPVVKGIAAAVGYGLLGAFVQAEVLNLGQKLLLLKTGVTTKAQKEEAYNRIADSLIALAMTAVIIVIMLILHFIANVMKGVYNFVKGKVFGIKPTPVEGKGTAPGEGKGGSGEGKVKGADVVEIEGPTRDGRGTIKVLEDGRVIVRRSCEELRIKYSDELNAKKKDGKALTDEAQDLNNKVNEADKITDPKEKKAAMVAVEDELAPKRQARRATEPVEVKMQELEKLRETTGEAIDRINPEPPKGNTNAITEGEAKLLEGRKSLKKAQTEAADAKAQGKADAQELETKATELENKLNELDTALGKAKGEHRDIQSEWKAAEGEAKLIEEDPKLQDPAFIDEARDRLENVRTRAKLAEKEIQEALAEKPSGVTEIDIHGQKLKSSYGPEAEKWLADHPNYVDKFNKAMEKGAVAPTGQSGIVPSELGAPYKYKLKILGQGGNYRIHGRVEGDRIIWDRVTDHD